MRRFNKWFHTLTLCSNYFFLFFFFFSYLFFFSFLLFFSFSFYFLFILFSWLFLDFFFASFIFFSSFLFFFHFLSHKLSREEEEMQSNLHFSNFLFSFPQTKSRRKKKCSQIFTSQISSFLSPLFFMSSTFFLRVFFILPKSKQERKTASHDPYFFISFSFNFLCLINFSPSR